MGVGRSVQKRCTSEITSGVEDGFIKDRLDWGVANNPTLMKILCCAKFILMFWFYKQLQPYTIKCSYAVLNKNILASTIIKPNIQILKAKKHIKLNSKSMNQV